MNLFKQDSKDEKVFRKALSNKIYVSSIDEAKKMISHSNQPTFIQFHSLSLGREDLSEIRRLSDQVEDKPIFISYDEVDVLETKKDRLKRVSNSIKLFAKTNSGQIKATINQAWYREHKKY